MRGTTEKTAAQVELLEKVLEGLAEKVATLEAEKTQSSAIVEQSGSNYAEIPRDTFEFEKGTYKFLVSGIFHDGQKILASEAVEKGAETLALFVKTYPKTVAKINL